jgi:tripartite-type tricarboxylate transporter receptor subunit TctC
LAAGGITDVVARVVGERMRASLDQPIIIENVGGADGSIGTGRAGPRKAGRLHDTLSVSWDRMW